ncbi:MAG: hypothetical protein K2Q06_16315 [Parvularculaceae bacterium]|nr:hypothetical protein [Parvularculaceae bacterium]
MIDATFTFRKEGLADDATTRAENVNGIAGKACAEWVKAALGPVLPAATFDNVAIPEDWGWAMIVKLGPDLFVLGCSGEDEDQSRWSVAIGDNFSRGFFPWTRRRKESAAAIIADALGKVLRSTPGVSEVARDDA